jgi:gamma-glutamylcyclotransferase (GGCT)/AIG2-like uncharacterized protein YtfP
MHVFAYGSLMIPSVMEAVTGRRFAARKALLHGYARFRLEGASYPGLIPQVNAKTDGMLYLDVDAQSIARLDAFEGDFYDRVRVEVDVEAGGRLAGEAYVVGPAHRHRLSSEAWRIDDFRREHLATFLASYPGFLSIRD